MKFSTTKLTINLSEDSRIFYAMGRYKKIVEAAGFDSSEKLLDEDCFAFKTNCKTSPELEKKAWEIDFEKVEAFEAKEKENVLNRLKCAFPFAEIITL